MAWGNQIALRASEYRPDTPAGSRLLVHELVHVARHLPTLPPGAALYAKAAPDLLNYDLLAEDVHRAVAGWGTDEEGIYVALQRLDRDATRIKKLRKAYRAKFGETLDEALQDDLSRGELRYVLSLLNESEPDAGERIGARPSTGDERKAAARRVRDAVEGAGTDEEAIFAVLSSLDRDAAAVTHLEQTYKSLYGEGLRERLVDEMSGAELDYALRLMGEQPASLARETARDMLGHIRKEAYKRAQSPPSIDPSSKFYTVLRDQYLRDYLAKPTKAEGRRAVEGIGRSVEGRVGGGGRVEVRPHGAGWRPARGRWEAGAIKHWNQQQLPELPPDVRGLDLFQNLEGLPRDLGAATEVLLHENTRDLSHLDVPFLVGRPNLATGDLMADVRGGGKNISQLMHWATGVKYADQSPEALRELFLAYEMWHLEGWDIFGQDPINDLIAEEQGRLLGRELLKGAKGAIKKESDLLPFLNRSFLEARAWVGALLRMRRTELDEWILAEEQPTAVIHWDEGRRMKMWPEETVQQMAARGLSPSKIKQSYLVQAQIEIYTLIFEAEAWEKANGPVKLTPLQKALVGGRLNRILAVMAKGSEATTGELLEAKSNLDELKGGGSS